LVLVLLTTAPAVATEYQINFRDGTSLRTHRVSQVAGEIRYEKFGGEARVAVGEVATVYVLEKDGTVTWVMEPRQDGSRPPAPAPQPVATPPVNGPAPPPVAGTPAPPVPPAPAVKAGPQPPAVPPVAAPPEAAQPPPSAATGISVAQHGSPAGSAGGARPPITAGGPPAATPATVAATAETPPPPPPVPPTPHAKVVVTPSEPLATRLLRWGGAPVGVVVVLGGGLLLFRRHFRAAQKGAPVTAAPAGGEVEMDFSVPSKAWETLTNAMEGRNFDVYRLCWVLHLSDDDLQPAFQKGLINWKYYDYTITKAEPHPKNKERFYLHIKRSTKFDREDLEERVKRLSLLRTDGGWKFEEVPYGF